MSVLLPTSRRPLRSHRTRVTSVVQGRSLADQQVTCLQVLARPMLALTGHRKIIRHISCYCFLVVVKISGSAEDRDRCGEADGVVS